MQLNGACDGCRQEAPCNSECMCPRSSYPRMHLHPETRAQRYPKKTPHPAKSLRRVATTQLVMFKSAHLKNLCNSVCVVEATLAASVCRQRTAPASRSHRSRASIRMRCWWCSSPSWASGAVAAVAKQLCLGWAAVAVVADPFLLKSRRTLTDLSRKHEHVNSAPSVLAAS